MVKKTIVIRNEAGMHLRPAQAVCSKAMEYEDTKIMVRFRDREFNAKSILGLLSACIQQSNEICIVCEGPQETEAAEGMVAFISREFGGVVEIDG